MERRNSVNQIKSLAYSAGRNISMDPERYGEHMLDALEQELQVFMAKLPEEVREHYEAAYIEKYSLWLSAMSRCFSQFITGAGGWKPATFRRHEKTNQAERNARVRLDEWADKVVKRCNRQHRLTGWDEVERLQDKVEKLTALQEMMKAANKVIRSKKLSEVEQVDELVALGFKEEQATELLTDDGRSWWGKGFAPFQLTNNNAKIKDAQARLDRLTAMLGNDDTEEEHSWGTLAMCYSEERIRFVFSEIPSSEVRSLLKSNGFKWSPKNSAWQRQLTPNAQYVTKRIIQQLESVSE